MLVLSRKENESIIIDDHIEIMVVKVQGDKVRIGINAPADVPVHRGEVAKKIALDNASVCGREGQLP
jgi:carbon storage regulator